MLQTENVKTLTKEDVPLGELDQESSNPELTLDLSSSTGTETGWQQNFGGNGHSSRKAEAGHRAIVASLISADY